MRCLVEKTASHFNLDDDSLQVALNEFVENGPLETVGSTLATSVEAENMLE